MGVGVFPSDGAAWGVGVFVGAVLAAIVLGAIGVAFRRAICPRGQASEPEDLAATQRPREDEGNDALEVVSTGSAERVRPHVGAFAMDPAESHTPRDDSTEAHSPRDDDRGRAIRSIVVAKAAVDKKRHWKF